MQDPNIVHKALQMWIGAFYFSFAQLETVKDGISTSDIEYGLKLFDRLVVTIDNVHIRVEDVYTAHIPPPIGRELICLGLVIGNIEFRSPSSQEMIIDNGIVWQTSSNSKLVQINKLYQAKNIQLYCARENGLGSTQDDELCIEFVRKVSYLRKIGNIIGPSEAIIKASVAYHRANQVFGPINVTIDGKNFDIHINDEQTAYISDFAQAFDHHLHKVQLNSKLDHCRSADDKCRRARMRWALLRDSMKIDWNKYVNTLNEGSIRWRTWFNTWRIAARYVALREILLYHVGFEAVLDQNGDTVSYSISESLFADHYRENKLNSKSNDSSPSQTVSTNIKKNVGRYRGFGLFTTTQLQTAETILRKQMASSGDLSGFNDNIDPLSLAGSVIRALYAIQLDMDTYLPIKVSAKCRIWAEDKYRLKRAREMLLPIPESDNIIESNEDMQTKVGGVEVQTKVLLLAVVDSVNLRGTFGVRNLETYCTITPQSGSKKSAPIVTESANIKKHKSGTGFGAWGEIFGLPVDSGFDEGIDQYIFECNTRGYFTPSYGRLVIPKSHFLKTASVVADTFNESDIKTTHCNLTIPTAKGLFSSNENSDYSKYLTDIALASPDPELPSVRLMSMVVEGSERFQSAVRARFSVRVQEAITERTLVVQRHQELAAREAMRNDEDDVEEVFILDPSALTIHDLNLSIKFSRMSVTVELLYLTPAPLRAQISKISSKELPHFKSIPLAYMLIKGLEASAQGSNNPWVIRAKLSVQKIKFQEIYNSQLVLKGNEKRKECFSLKIPSIHAELNVTQTSTMSRTIGAFLDESCFDFDGFAEMPPFKVTLNPRSFYIASGSKSVTLWKMYRILQHLWTQRTEWALGHGFNSMGEDSKYPNQYPEASLRLGNAYTAKPKHMNVISEYLASIRHIDENYGNDISKETLKLLPQQVSVLTMVTETRTMDVSVNCRTDSDSLWYNENHLENSDDDDVSDDDVEAVLVNTTKSTGYLDWMSPVGNIVAAAGGVVGLGGNIDEAERQRIKSQKKFNRQNERKLMIARIKQLEEKVAELERKK
jgi:hypothetical protein